MKKNFVLFVVKTIPNITKTTIFVITDNLNYEKNNFDNGYYNCRNFIWTK